MQALQRRVLWIVAAAAVALLAGAAAREAASPDELVRRGNEAFGRGDFAAAADLFQKAQERAADPGLATYNLALAKYRLARLSDDGGAELSEAAALFRCCLAADDPRRPKALYGLGACLLHGPAGPRGQNLRDAVDAFAQCLQEAAPGSALADDARANLELARLLAAQYQPPTGRSDDDPGGDDPSRAPPNLRPDARPGDHGDRALGPRDPNGVGADQGSDDPMGADGGREAGTQPSKPLPATDKDEPLAAAEAETHLNWAVPRVLQDRRDNRRRNVRPVPEGVRDW